MLVQTARDLDDGSSWYNRGPDYASGYGVVQIVDSIDLIATGRVLQGKITEGRVDRYFIDVPAGTPLLRFTLAWDDPAPAAGAADILVNDLDLYLVDPDGNRYFAWTLDTANPDADAVRTDPDRRNNLEQVLVDASVAPGGILPSGQWEVLVNPHAVPDGPQRYALVGSAPMRGAVDVMLVLDRSGSMRGTASPGMPDSKIETLRTAATQLVETMRVDEGFQLGIVQLSTDVVPFLPDSQDALDLHTSERAMALKADAIPAIVAHGRTSIGDGLREAHSQLTASPSPADIDRVILLVTDGKENEPETIAAVKPDLIDADITVNVLGLGYNAGIDAALLTDLADDTHGSYRITADHLAFRKLFLEALVGVVDWDLVADPPGRLEVGSEATVPFTLAADETGAIISVVWQGAPQGVELALVTPGGRIIDRNTTGIGIRYVVGDRYAFVDLDPPLSGDLAGEWAGDWQVRLTGAADAPPGQYVPYAVSVFAEGGATMTLEAEQTAFAGDSLQLLARLQRRARPLAGAQVEVMVDVPTTAVAKLLSGPVVAFQPAFVAEDPVSPVERKLALVDGGNRLSTERRRVVVKLFDDGKHGDEKANDGVYGNAFDGFELPGSYGFRAVAKGVPAGVRTTTREATLQRQASVAIDPSLSDMALERVGNIAGRLIVELSLTPRDRLGNAMGPGHVVQGQLKSAFRRVPFDLKDELNGRYSGRFTLPTAPIRRDDQVEVWIDHRPFVDVPLSDIRSR